MNLPTTQLRRTLLLTILALGGVSESFAANYSIPWHRFAAGGAVSAGGAYRSQGTLGQADAGTLRSVSVMTLQTEAIAAPGTPAESPAATSPSYSLVGGFQAVALHTPGAPTLAMIAGGAPGSFTWATMAQGYTLQQCARMDADANWTDVDAPVTTNGNVYSTVAVLNPFSGKRIYDLPQLTAAQVEAQVGEGEMHLAQGGSATHERAGRLELLEFLLGQGLAGLPVAGHAEQGGQDQAELLIAREDPTRQQAGDEAQQQDLHPAVAEETEVHRTFSCALSSNRGCRIPRRRRPRRRRASGPSARPRSVRR